MPRNVLSVRGLRRSGCADLRRLVDYRHISGCRTPDDGTTKHDWRQTVSPSAEGADVHLGDRLGLKPGTIVQELGWDEDVDDHVREEIENTIDADLVDGDYGDVVDAVLLWWRDDDGDLVDALVDAL